MRAALALAATFFGAATVFAAAPKYVFLFIGDGMSTPQRMVAEEFSRKTGQGPLAMNALRYVCHTRTRSANAVVTDSAAAATAIACGEKADNGALGVAPDGRRLKSVAEVARDKGYKVGIMTTVTIVHATPAGFYAHRRSRGDVVHIGLDLVASQFDFFAGGGFGSSAERDLETGFRADILKSAEAAGYALVRTQDAFAALKPGCGKVWGLFAPGRLNFAIDGSGRQPTLADMVAKGAELLDNPNGFFLMAEGGTVDYGAHGNDAATVLRDMLALDGAVKVAVAWKNAHPDETLIVTTGDHETGGMAMGFAGTGYDFRVELLARQKASFEAYSRLIGQMIAAKPSLSFDEVRPTLEANFGFVFEAKGSLTDADRKMVLTKAEKAELEAAFRDDVIFITHGKKETTAHDVKRRRRFSATAIRIMSNHAGVGWTSGAHTALPTMTTAEGVGAERFTGFLENSDIAIRLKALLAQ